MNNTNRIEQQNLHTLTRWYNDMWGQCNADPVTELVNTNYLRHDMTGANNLLSAEEYQAMTRLGSQGREVEDFTYYLIAEGDYVGALGRYIRDGNDQWDWVQIFRLENGLLSETWLPAMGGNEPRAFAMGENLWTGSELPTSSPNPDTEQKTLVRGMFEALSAGQDVASYFSKSVRWHDMSDANATLSPAEIQQRLTAWTQGDTASDLQLFMIEQDNILFSSGHWLLGEDKRTWDWVCAFRLEDNKIAQAWFVGINGSKVPVQQSIDVLWQEDVLPADSTRIGSKVD